MQAERAVEGAHKPEDGSAGDAYLVCSVHFTLLSGDLSLPSQVQLVANQGYHYVYFAMPHQLILRSRRSDLIIAYLDVLMSLHLPFLRSLEGCPIRYIINDNGRMCS